jgi:uncharacterized protein (TIGR03437 family)
MKPWDFVSPGTCCADGGPGEEEDVGVSKSLKRLAILGLLACGGAWAQNTVPVQVGLTVPGAIFLIDGQPFSTTQIVQWAVGSTHQVYFVQSQEPDGSLGNHQYATNNQGIRYTFSSWTIVGPSPLGATPLLTISVDPTLTSIIGQVTTEVQLTVSFTGFTDPNLPCSPTPVPNDPRQGVVLVGSACYSAPTSIWVVSGPQTLVAAPFPGYIFTNWLINGSYISPQTLTAYPLAFPSNVTAVFVKAKRVRIRSNPVGLSLIVDHQLVQPGPVYTSAYSGDPYCPIAYAQLPIPFPVGYVPLCIGDFDFVPGSTHLLAAPPVQNDAMSNTWVFTGFSNGLGQNSIYTANFDTSTTDTFFADFSAYAPTRVLTSPPGLTVNVDGQNLSTTTSLAWGAGQTHHLIAPPTQTDATGRPWTFVSWSQGGTADQMYTIPPNQAGLDLVATYQPAGKLQVTSVPSGLPFMVDGAACTTPCVLLTKPTGAQVQIVAPPSVTPDAFSRYTFGSWNGGSTATSFQVTITDQVQVFTATYNTFYKITATSQPPNFVGFQFTPPPTADGFFPGGTQVSVTAVPHNGYTFKNWSGDLSGTNPTASLVMNAEHFVTAVLNGFPYISAVQNSAGVTPSPAVGPGSLISILGDDLSATSKTSPPGELLQAIDDVWVTVNDRLLPLLYISPTMINAQIFSDLVDGPYTLTVHRTNQGDASQTFTIQRDSPGLFQLNPAQGSPTITGFRADGTVLTPDNPATANETITFFGTGFGFYDRPMVDGFPTPDTGDWNVLDPVTVTAGGQVYTPISAKAANGFAGLVAVQVKLGTLPSGLVNLKVTVGTVDSNTVQLPIK